MFQLDIVHYFPLQVLFMLHLRFNFAQLLLQLASLACNLRILNIVLSKHLALLFSHRGLTLGLRVDLFQLDLLSFQFVFDLDYPVIVVGVL